MEAEAVAQDAHGQPIALARAWPGHVEGQQRHVAELVLARVAHQVAALHAVGAARKGRRHGDQEVGQDRGVGVHHQSSLHARVF